MFSGIALIIIAWCAKMPLVASIFVTILGGLLTAISLINFGSKIAEAWKKNKEE